MVKINFGLAISAPAFYIVRVRGNYFLNYNITIHWRAQKMEIDLSRKINWNEIKFSLLDQAIQSSSPTPADLFIASFTYLHGYGLKGGVDARFALDCARRGVETGDLLCTAQYGLLLCGIDGTKKQGRDLISQVAGEISTLSDKEHFCARYLLARMHEDKLTPKSRVYDAIQLYKWLIDMQDANAQYRLALILLSGGHGSRHSGISSRVDLLSAAAKQGHAQAQLGLAIERESDRDMQQALEWGGESAQQGHPAALIRLGDWQVGTDKGPYPDRNGLEIAINLNAAFAKYKDASDRGDIEGMLKVAKCYERGFGVDQSLAQAFLIYDSFLRIDGADLFILVNLNRDHMDRIRDRWTSLFSDAQFEGGGKETSYLRFRDGSVIAIEPNTPEATHYSNYKTAMLKGGRMASVRTFFERLKQFRSTSIYRPYK